MAARPVQGAAVVRPEPSSRLRGCVWMLEIAVTAAAAFVATNVDDLVVLAVLFSRRSERLRTGQIVAGQYLGFAVIVGACLAAGSALGELSDQAVAALGLLPLALGVRGLLAGAGDERAPAGTVHGTLGVAAITLANGGDDVAVYVPLFAAVGAGEIGVTAAVFAALVGVWCAAGAYVGSHPAVVRTVDRLGHRAVPFVLIALGLYIVATALG